MHMYPVITISREFGSGGHSIGEKVAAKLGIPFYDGEIVTRVAEESGYAKELIEEQGEYSTSANKWFDISAASAMYFQSPQDEIFIAQKRVILDCAAKGPCVIVGRCADYALADEPHCLNIFIRSNMDDRIKRISERLNVPENKAKDIIKKKDKERSSYYNYYTSKKWGDARSYDLCLNTSQISVEDSIELILKYRECMRSHNK